MGLMGLPPSHEDVRLCEATYAPCSMGIGSIRLVVQVINLAGEEMMWVDGIDIADPVMVPLSNLSDVREIGSLSSFMENHQDAIVSLALLEDFSRVSPTLLARAVLNMAGGAAEPREAMSLARMFSCFIKEADELDRKVFDKVVNETLTWAREAPTFGAQAHG